MEVERVLAASQIQVRLVDNINEELWEKFASIIGFAGFTAATRRPIEPVLREPLAEPLMQRCGKWQRGIERAGSGEGTRAGSWEGPRAGSWEGPRARGGDRGTER